METVVWLHHPHGQFTFRATWAPGERGAAGLPHDTARVPEVLVHNHHSQLEFSGLRETHSPLQLLRAQMTLIFI